jgi:hypothetical protein
MPSAGFEPVIPAGERLQIHALDRTATGIGSHTHIQTRNFEKHNFIAINKFLVLITNIVVYFSNYPSVLL